jgi:hypothetical protein
MRTPGPVGVDQGDQFCRTATRLGPPRRCWRRVLRGARGAAGRRRVARAGRHLRDTCVHRAPVGRGRPVEASAPRCLPGGWAPLHQRGAHPGGRPLGRATGRDHRARGRVLAPDARAGPDLHRPDRAGRTQAQAAGGSSSSSPRPGPGGRAAAVGCAGGGKAVRRARDGGRPARRLGVPRPGVAEARPVRRGLPRLLPQHGDGPDLPRRVGCWLLRPTGPTRLRSGCSFGCCGRRGSAAGCSVTRSAPIGSTWPSPRIGWPSRWTAGRTTSTRSGSATTGARGTSSPAADGTAPLHLARPRHPARRIAAGDHRYPRSRRMITGSGTWRPYMGVRSRL